METRLPWFKGMTPELEKHALETLGETPEVREKALEKLRLYISETRLNLRNDGVFLLRFLRAKKYDVEKASKAVIRYYKFTEKQNGLFLRRKPSEIKEFLGMNFTSMHPYALPDGSLLSITLAGNFDVNRGSQQDMLSAFLAVGELSLEHEAAQVVGVTRVVDFTGFTFNHYLQFAKPSFLSLVLLGLQDSWPERILAIHIVHEPTLMHAVAKVILPLLKKKMRERFHFHGDNLESLHRFVPEEYLPEELGGSTGPFDSSKYIEYICSHEDLFTEANEFGLYEKNSVLKDSRLK